MKRARIEYEIDGDTRVATFEAEGIGSAPDFPPVPTLMVQVEDAEDADALVALIEKHDKASGQPKKRKPRASTKPSAQAGPPSVKCIVPDCTFDADTFAAADSDLCRNHHDATEEHKAVWRMEAKKPTPAPIARKRAKEIGEHLAGGDGAKASA